MAVTLLGTLAGAMLPNGQIPKLAGPCGRSLCNCTIQPADVEHCSTCKIVTHYVQRVWTLGGSAMPAGGDTEHISFQTVVDAALVDAAAAPKIAVARCESTCVLPAYRFVVLTFKPEIPTQPPRAA